MSAPAKASAPILLLDGRVEIHVGDVMARLALLPADSVDCVVTSPPYWGQRDYEVDGQIGLEPTLGAHLAVIVEVFEEIRRVLKPTGSVWLNYGDCYATSPNGRSAAATKAAGDDDRTFRDKPFGTVGAVYAAEYEKTDRTGAGANKSNTAGAHGGRVVGKTPQGGFPAPEMARRNVGTPRARAGGYLKPKDLCMVPNRLAIALQDAGWWVRSEIIWGKDNAMPDSSGKYRPSVAHEKIFLLTKSIDGNCWVARDTGDVSFDPDLSEQCGLVTKPHILVNRWIRMSTYYDAMAVRQNLSGNTHDRGTKRSPPIDGAGVGHRNWSQYMTRDDAIQGKRPGGRNGYGRHTLGDALPETERRDKQAGHGRRHEGFNERWRARKRGSTPRHDGHIENEFLDDLGRGEGRYLRNYEPAPLEVWAMATKPFSGAHFATFPPELVARALEAGCPPGGLVLDPFGGAGTVGLVAARLGRRAQLIELSDDYVEIARERIEAEWRVTRRGTPADSPGPLFEGAS